MPERSPTRWPRTRTVARAHSIAALRRAARRCRACPLWKPATQTVFGTGPDDARIMLIGEQAGDREDVEGLPFVGLRDACSIRRWSRSGSIAMRST